MTVRRTRVVFLATRSGLGGMERTLSYILRHLDQQRFEALVLVTQDGVMVEDYRRHVAVDVYAPPTAPRWQQVLARGGRAARARLPFLPRPGVGPSRSELARQRRWGVEAVGRFEPDLVVWHHHHPVPHFQDVADLGIASLQPIAIHWSAIAWMAEHDLRALTSRDHFVCEGVGGLAYSRYWLGIPSDRISTVCIGIDLDLRDRQLAEPGRPTRADLGIPDDALVIGSIGQLRFVKGADLLVQAAALLKQRRPDRPIKVLWVGGRPGKFRGFHGVALLRLIEECGLGDDVIFTGEQEAVYHYLDLCDVYVQASRDDPFPHATLEAMAVGKPVVSFAQGVALEDYAAGSLVRVDVMTPDALADALDQLLDDPHRRAALGRAGVEFVVERMDLVRSVRAYEEVLELVAGGARRDGSGGAGGAEPAGGADGAEPSGSRGRRS